MHDIPVLTKVSPYVTTVSAKFSGNEPINRADSSGQGWFVLGAIVAGAVIGGTIKVISNIVNKKKPLDGVAGAVVGSITEWIDVSYMVFICNFFSVRSFYT